MASPLLLFVLNPRIFCFHHLARSGLTSYTLESTFSAINSKANDLLLEMLGEHRLKRNAQ